MEHVVNLRTQAGKKDVSALVGSVVPQVSTPVLQKLIDFAAYMDMIAADPTSSLQGISPLTLRQMLRVARRVAQYPEENTFDVLSNACMTRFMPAAEREAIDEILRSLGMSHSPVTEQTPEIVLQNENGVLQIGNTSTRLTVPNNPALVPDVLFYDVPAHKRILQVCVC
jgi:hypothetical protein